MSGPNNPNADQETLEPDSSDQDSAYVGTNISGSWVSSLASSIYNYPERYGRTYHAYKNGRYKFPNDEPELNRLDLQHHLYYQRLDEKLFLAPISNTPQNVLDIGTGTGIWAIDFADLYPSASVIGTDLSPTQPKWVPPNVQFEVDDSSDNWVYSRKFDLIHCRQLHMSLEEKRLFQQSFDALIPGGWLEIKEVSYPLECQDDTLKGTSLSKWTDEMIKASKKINTPFDNPHHYRQWMEEAGFVNVKEVVYPLPLNTWPENPKLKEIGQWQLLNLLEGLEGFSLVLFTDILKWSKEELEVFLVDVRNDIGNRNIHAFWNLVAVIGQKPPQNTTDAFE
jgi:trans-aconitate methyltransferase